jgi:hypothetical protein
MRMFGSAKSVITPQQLYHVNDVMAMTLHSSNLHTLLIIPSFHPTLVLKGGTVKVTAMAAETWSGSSLYSVQSIDSTTSA